MIVFEARNSYELLVSFVLGKNLTTHDPQQRVTILCVNLDPALNYRALEASGIHTLRLKTSRYLYTLQLLRTICKSKTLSFSSIMRIFVFHEISPLSLCHLIGRQVNLLEHGEINYRNIASVYGQRHPYRMLKRLFGQSFVGEGSLFSHIYLKDPDLAPAAIIKKVQPLDIQVYYDALAPTYQKALLNLFDCDPSPTASDISIKIIATQPFSELNMMSENSKICMYRSLMQDPAQTYYIKPHPRETTNYSQAFPNAVIMDQKIPFELFWLAGLRNVDVYTVHSSIGRMRGLNVICLGENFLNEFRH